MTVIETLQFLRAHQPMPDDDVITRSIADQFVAALEVLEANPTVEAIPLLLGTVGRSTGLGMYEHITFVLQKFAANEVAPPLIQALGHTLAQVRTRAAWWCADCPSQLVVGPLLQQLSVEPDEDARFAINVALEACSLNHASSDHHSAP